MKAYTLSTFAKTTDGGNAAGVVLNSDSLSETEMRKIASILGFSETAFVMKSDCADFKVRFFSPVAEVDFCGHATLGTFFTLASQKYIGIGKYLQETNAGVLAVEVKKDLSIMMNQPLPKFFETIDRKVIADSLNISPSETLGEFPIQIVSTGLRDIFIPVKSLDTLHSIVPDFEKVIEISRIHDVTGYHVFTLESINKSNAHCRNFAPLYGIPEESATGSSSGALGCYLFHYGVLNRHQAENMIFEQGYSMRKPSEINVSLTIEGKEVLEVKVGGKALNLNEIQLLLK